MLVWVIEMARSTPELCIPFAFLELWPNDKEYVSQFPFHVLGLSTEMRVEMMSAIYSLGT